MNVCVPKTDALVTMLMDFEPYGIFMTMCVYYFTFSRHH
jgi:hypothetical protein